MMYMIKCVSIYVLTPMWATIPRRVYMLANFSEPVVSLIAGFLLFGVLVVILRWAFRINKIVELLEGNLYCLKYLCTCEQNRSDTPDPSPTEIKSIE